MNQQEKQPMDLFPLAPEDWDLLRQMISYLEAKLKIATALPALRFPRFGEIPATHASSAIDNVAEGDRVFARLQALPPERFALAMDALMMAIVIRGVMAIPEGSKAEVFFEEITRKNARRNT